MTDPKKVINMKTKPPEPKAKGRPEQVVPDIRIFQMIPAYIRIYIRAKAKNTDAHAIIAPVHGWALVIRREGGNEVQGIVPLIAYQGTLAPAPFVYDKYELVSETTAQEEEQKNKSFETL